MHRHTAAAQAAAYMLSALDRQLGTRTERVAADKAVLAEIVSRKRTADLSAHPGTRTPSHMSAKPPETMPETTESGADAVESRRQSNTTTRHRTTRPRPNRAHTPTQVGA